MRFVFAASAAFAMSVLLAQLALGDAQQPQDAPAERVEAAGSPGPTVSPSGRRQSRVQTLALGSLLWTVDVLDQKTNTQRAWHGCLYQLSSPASSDGHAGWL